MTDLPPPPWRRAPKPARPVRPALGRDQIVDAGLQILLAEGVDAISMRRVAAVFETGASSLYAHVANKEELLALMFDRVVGEVALPEPDPATWAEQIKAVARDGHRTMLRYNDISRTSLATVPTGPNALRMTEGMLAIMLAGDVPPQTAAWFLDQLFLFITASAVETSLHQGEVRAERREGADYYRELVGYFEALPEARFPLVRKHARELTAGDNHDRFEFGLDLLVAGVSRLAGLEGQ